MKILQTIAVAAAMVAATSAGAVTVQNGSFETTAAPVPDGSFTTVGTGSTFLTGWNVTGSIDVVGTYWQAAEGNNSLDMNGFNSGGQIQQDVAGFTEGKTYKLTFAISGNPDDAPGDKLLNVTLDDGFGNYSFNTAFNTHADMGWRTETLVFTALTTGTQRLRFTSGMAGSWGAALDNVSLSEVPLPAGAGLLLAGLGALAAVRRRRRAA